MYSKGTIPVVREVSAVINVLISWGTGEEKKLYHRDSRVDRTLFSVFVVLI